ncbi:MAG: dicarboxylate/amino acid:cation symporter [Cytophagales bacterium]|nr:dicarboxylate/amino acid:cation symporter [Cytophagales bacterium]
MKRKIPLHLKIVIGLIAGLVCGLTFIFSGVPAHITIHYIKPFGTIFVNSLKMIAVPLVLASLIVGVANLGDISKLSRMGGKTIGVYILTTVIATTIGLTVVNLAQPGKFIKEETRMELLALYEDSASKKMEAATVVKNEGPLQPLVDMVPTNVFQAAADNRSMLQVVFFAVLIGIALLSVPKEKGAPLVSFFNGLNEVILKIIDFVMLLAPFGVFALITSIIVELAGKNPAKALEILGALGGYGATVICGLALMVFAVYPLVLSFFSRFNYFRFFRGIRQAQLLAFSTSSSSATLPVTMECVEKKLGVPEEVSSFVLPLGATINMDGTSLYQAVAAVFIAQALGIELAISQQIMIVVTATLASIGSAGVPGAGMVMLVIVLEAINIPAAGLALIIAPDRILDMCRTVVNVTGDSMVTMLVAKTEGTKLQPNLDEEDAVELD